ncbi:MAG: cold shock domain-containing protein [Rhodobacteraceae bacterium]|nr:cold shock domain-containing protein [Paracoccaceae bacterium]
MSDRWTIDGEVKWFDARRGFGFVVSEQADRDILLHANILRNFGQGSIAEGTAVRLEVHESERGLQATRIIDIAVQATKDAEGLHGDEDVDRSDDFLPARVKWFDPSRGFGFLNVFGDPRDVFLHVDVLRNSSMSELQPGEAISLRVAIGPRGLVAEEIRPWDSRVG